MIRVFLEHDENVHALLLKMVLLHHRVASRPLTASRFVQQQQSTHTGARAERHQIEPADFSDVPVKLSMTPSQSHRGCEFVTPPSDQHCYTREGTKRMPIGSVMAMTTPRLTRLPGVSTRAIEPPNVRATTNAAAAAAPPIAIAHANRLSRDSPISAT